MSSDPVRNVALFASGDITSGRNMLGLTTSVVDASVGPILQTPGAFYSDYFTNYFVSLTGSGFFDLGQIGASGVSIGYTMCISCTTGAGQLTVRAFDSSIVATMVAGDKLFLTALASTSTWRVSYAVPQGTNNLLLVYNGTNPRAQTLPIQKEISINGSLQYGVKCLTSFDFTEPAFWTNVAQTNQNRIVSLANTASVINTTALTGAACHLTAASTSCTSVLNNTSYSLMLGSNTCTVNDNGGLTSMISSTNSQITNNVGRSIMIGSDISDISANGDGLSAVINSKETNLFNQTGLLSTITCNKCDLNTQPGSIGALAALIASSECTINLEGASSMAVISSDLATITEVRDSNGISLISTNNQSITASVGLVTNPYPYCSSISCNGSYMQELIGASSGVSFSSMIGCNQCGIVNFSTPTIALPPGYNLITSSFDSETLNSAFTFQSSSQNGNTSDSTYSSVTSSFDSRTNNLTTFSGVGSSSSCICDGTIIASILSSSNVTIAGDGNTSTVGFPNIGAGITILSSNNIIPASASDLRYCVIGGFNTPTWSIDSKTGNYYGLGVFNAGTPLPGIAEMYENLVNEVIPYGRLLQLQDGKVRLATNGESGFVISRPHSTAAFVGGNPMFDWPKKYITDEFGLPIYQDYTKDEYIGILKSQGKTDSQIEKMKLGDIVHDKKLNPDYDPKLVYIPRSSRTDQWTTCEKSGIVVVEYVGQLSVGDYVVSASNGLAKQSTRKTNIKVLSISDMFAKVDIENASYGEYVYLDGSVPNTGPTSSAAGLPADIVIKSLSFADDSIVLSADTKLKLSIDIVGDMMTATDILVNLSDGVNTYWFSTTYARTSGNYKISSVIKSIIPAGSYKINFVTSKTQPSHFAGSLKLY